MTGLGRHRVAWVLGCLWAAAAQPALLACPVCFQVEHGAVTDGVRAAVLVLIGVTSAVLTGFAVFIGRFVRHEARQRHV